jgi:cytochrome c peroxidase
MRAAAIVSIGIMVCVVAALTAGRFMAAPTWSSAERASIKSMALSALPDHPPDPSNSFADNPQAAALGKSLFFDTRLSGDGRIACSSCQQPALQFQDGLPVGHGVGVGNRRTMPIATSAYSPFLFWDGRKDSEWSQALGPLENPLEHGADRTMIVRLVVAAYRPSYEALFGPLPDVKGVPEHAMPSGDVALVAAWRHLPPEKQDSIDRVFANVGKAIAAFERTISPSATRFDAYARALDTENPAAADALMTAMERQGLRLFIGKAECATCHTGPLLSDNAFHNIGLPGADPTNDLGRSTAVAEVRADPFNCLGHFSDAGPAQCKELQFIAADDPKAVGAFRTPSLRGVALRAPFMHAGQFTSLQDVLKHYDIAPAASVGNSELRPLALNEEGLGALEAFLRTLDPEPPAKPDLMRR